MREKVTAWKHTLIILAGSIASNLAAELLADDVRALLTTGMASARALLHTLMP